MIKKMGYITILLIFFVISGIFLLLHKDIIVEAYYHRWSFENVYGTPNDIVGANMTIIGRKRNLLGSTNEEETRNVTQNENWKIIGEITWKFDNVNNGDKICVVEYINNYYANGNNRLQAGYISIWCEGTNSSIYKKMSNTSQCIEYINNRGKTVNERFKITLYYDIYYTLSKDGGIGGSSSFVYSTYQQKITTSLSLPTKTGYKFNGYYTSDGILVVNSLGNFVWSRDNCYPTTLYAKWTPNTYIVSYNGNGSTSGSMTDQSFTYDASQSLKRNSFYKTGYSFLGWATSSSGSIVYSDGASVKNLAPSGTVTLYAKWAANTYIITLDKQDGSGEKSIIYLKYNTGWYSNNTSTTPISTITTPTRTGYTFKGYYTGTNGSQTQIINSEGNIIGSNTYTAVSDTLYAYWIPNIYTITLNKQSGSEGTSTIYLKYNTSWCSNSTGTATITSITTPARTGYTFSGYYTGTNGSGTQIINSTGSIVGSKTYVAANDTLYAYWTANTYTIQFNKNTPSGTTVTGTMNDLKMTYDIAQNLTANTYAAQGYYFIGWSTSAAGVQTSVTGGVTYKDGTSVSNLATSGTVTLYAVWLDTWANHATAPTSGNGTSSSPYVIDSAEKLAWLIYHHNNNSRANYFKQTKKIDIGSRYWYPVGISTAKFGGVYDGQGNEITNLNIPNITNADGEYIQSNIGLFGYTEGNAIIMKIYLNNAIVYGNENVGLISANISGTTEISSNIIENSKIYAKGNFGAISGKTVSGTSIKYNLVYITTSGGTSINGIYTGSATLATNLIENNGTRSDIGAQDLTGWGKVNNRLLPSLTFWGARATPITSADFSNWINKTID